MYTSNIQAGMSLTPIDGGNLWTGTWRIILCDRATQWFDSFNVFTNETTCNQYINIKLNFGVNFLYFFINKNEI